MPMTPNTEQDWKVWRNLMWSEILTVSFQSFLVLNGLNAIIINHTKNE